MNIVLLGFPGAGKGTQAEKLVEKYNFRHISTGDLIRHEIALGTPLGKEVEAVIDSGNLASDELIINILVNAIKDEKRGVIFDGFPRTLAQAEALDRYLTLHGGKVDAAVLLNLSEEEVLKRLTSRRVCKECGAVYNIYAPDYTGRCTKCGGELYIRHDDDVHSARHRLEVFHKETQPLIEYYKKSGICKVVDGSKSIVSVFAEIVAVLGLSKGEEK